MSELKTTSQRPLRVAMVSSFMPPHLGGLEVAAEAIFNAYVATGWETRWIASRVPKTCPSVDSGRLRVRCWNGLEDWCGVPWPIWGPKAMRELARLVDWADVLHAHDCLYMSSALAVLMAGHRNKPVLLSQHIGFVHYSSPVLNLLERLAYNTLGRAVLCRVSHITYCSPVVEDFIRSLMKDLAVSATTIPYGIDTQRFRPATSSERADARHRLGVPDTGHIILFVGRLVEKKGVHLFYEVSQRLPHCHFLMIGDGPLRPPSAKNLTWLPYIRFDEMQVAYEAANFFLLPSYDESFCIAAYEAMAAGVPVILSKNEGHTRWLEPRGVCLLAERTVSALCERVQLLCTTPDLATQLAKQARDFVVKEYSLEAVGVRYLQLMCELVARRHSF